MQYVKQTLHFIFAVTRISSLTPCRHHFRAPSESEQMIRRRTSDIRTSIINCEQMTTTDSSRLFSLPCVMAGYFFRSLEGKSVIRCARRIALFLQKSWQRKLNSVPLQGCRRNEQEARLSVQCLLWTSDAFCYRKKNTLSPLLLLLLTFLCHLT